MWHRHDEFELNLIVRGEGTRWLGSGSERFRPGDIVLVAPGTPHSWASDAANDAVSEAIVVLFRPDILGAIEQFPEFKRARFLLESIRSGQCIEDDSGVLGRAITSLTRASGSIRLLRFLALLDQLAAAPRRPLAATSMNTRAQTRERALVAQVLSLVDAERQKPLRQAEMAARLALSPSTFSRAFRRAAGMTYSAFMVARRVDRACTLLQRGDLGITQVSYAAGFNNSSNFNRCFRAAIGETPREYRRRFLREMA